MKNLEIEKRFLLFPCSIKKFLHKNRLSYRVFPILQFYLPSREGEVVRYRKVGKRFIKTVKRGEGLVREEFEEDVDKEEFLKALLNKEGRVVYKNRYKVKYNNLNFELDEFLKNLRGLNILEVEFKDENEASSFVLPDIFKPLVIKEITSFREFSNKALSKSFYPPSFEFDFETFLKDFSPSLKASLNISAFPYVSLKDLIKVSVFSLINSAKLNKEAILNGDMDSERLHQFRVSFRKLRSIFEALNFAFNREFLEWQKESLKILMKYTNEIRDIDVFLENLQKYREVLPKKLKDSLNPIYFKLLKEKREKHKSLKAFLESEFIKEILEFLECFSKSKDESFFSKEASSPAIIKAKEVLFFLRDDFVKRSKKIKISSSSKKYHTLRIEAKKIRYLGEFFHCVLEENSYKKFEKSLKDLQTILGEHQDFEIQRERLKDILKNENLNKESKEAVKFLIAFLKKEILKRRKKFKKFSKKFKQNREFRAMICRY